MVAANTYVAYCCKDKKKSESFPLTDKRHNFKSLIKLCSRYLVGLEEIYKGNNDKCVCCVGP